MKDLDTNQTECPFCGKGVEDRIIKEYGRAIHRIQGAGCGASFRKRWRIEIIDFYQRIIPRISDGRADSCGQI